MKVSPMKNTKRNSVVNDRQLELRELHVSKCDKKMQRSELRDMKRFVVEED
jgi:hypothetical protein